jgi:hypothetical protein
MRGTMMKAEKVERNPHCFGIATSLALSALSPFYGD